MQTSTYNKPLQSSILPQERLQYFTMLSDLQYTKLRVNLALNPEWQLDCLP